MVLAGCGAEAEPADVSQAVAMAQPGGQTPPTGADSIAPVCQAEGPLRPLPEAVHEASGAAASRRHPGIIWTHNDSGDPELFAVNAAGQLAGRVRIRGAENQDWEDIAVAPCPSGGACLYIADIGDNEAERASVTIYRVPEPALDDAQTGPAEMIRARYPDGAHDAEALFVLPDGTVHILTKGETGAVALYRLPVDTPTSSVLVMERLREFADGEVKRSERITGADASRDGRWIAIRTLNEAAIYPTNAFLQGRDQPIGRADLRALKEAQGEGIAFAGDGALVLTSEGGKKEDPATLGQMTCTLE